MKKSLFTTLLLAMWALMASAQIIYEDFENGGKLTWQPFGDGTYNGIVDNPDKAAANTSDKCGSYTKSTAHDYSLFITVLPAPMDLSVNNEFRIMVYAPVATKFLFKLEGPGGAIEGKRNIVRTNVWEEYVFNFSAAKGKVFDKIILFFDYGVKTSGDTYLFDNIIAVPSGNCDGVVANEDIIDDFECQRNTAYDNGYPHLAAIDNPDKSGINTSAKVGRYTDPSGTGTEWEALVCDFDDPLSFKTKNIVSIKIWSPKVTQVMFKVEQKPYKEAKEVRLDITEPNKWVEYSVDFSAVKDFSFNRIVFFFGPGVNGQPGDIYYIDDITLTAAPPLENFENPTGPTMYWEPLNGNTAVHGTFAGAIVNPDPTGINKSSKVGKYTRAGTEFSTLSGTFVKDLNLSVYPQLNFDVWAPIGSTKIRVQLLSASQGTKEAEALLKTPGSWEKVSFDFTNFASVKDFSSMNILFDPGTTGTGMYFFDNLYQSESTIDPCALVTKNPNIFDDFECQRNATLKGGADKTRIVDNPKSNAINSSFKVAEYSDPPNDPWAAMSWETGANFDLTRRNQLLVKILSPKKVPILFKLEGGPDGQKEIWQNVETTDEWVLFTIDFSSVKDKKYGRLAIFLNGGVDTPDADKYYIDDIEWRLEPYLGCVTTFETPDDNLGKWQYFASESSLEGKQFDIVVDNPKKSPLNNSNKVAEFIERAGGDPWAGYFNSSLPAQIWMGTSKTLSMKVWADHACNFVLKIERSTNGYANAGDVKSAYTTPGQWQTLTWDYTSILPTNGAIYTTLAFIPDIETIPTEEKRYYFDDLAIGIASCTPSSVINPSELAALSVSPNPAHDELWLSNASQYARFEVYNLVGQRLLTVQTSGQESVRLDVQHLPKGMYLLAAYDQSGLAANGKFVKE